jgi:hypothetical protein
MILRISMRCFSVTSVAPSATRSGREGFHIRITLFPFPDHVVSISGSHGFLIRISWFSISGSRGFHIRITWFSISGSRGFHIRITWFSISGSRGFPYPDHVVSISGSRGFHIRITWFPYPDHAISVSGSCEFRLWIRTPTLKLNKKFVPQPTDN